MQAPKNLAGRAISLTVANAVFVVVGVLRMKFVAATLGLVAVGSFGQATLMQTLAITVATAGAVTAGRLGLSDGRASERSRLDASVRMFRRPLIAAGVIAPLLALSSPLLSQIYTGSTDHSWLFFLAALGIVPLVLAQTSLALIQVKGSAGELMRGSIAYLLTGGMAVSLLVLPGNERLAAASFVASPLLQCLSLMVCSPALRTAYGEALRHRLASGSAGVASKVARASLAVSLVTIGIDTALRAMLANRVGIEEIALLQPAQLLALQAFALVTVSVSQVVMVHQNQTADANNPSFVSGPWRTAIGISNAIAAPALLVACVATWLIPLFFSRELLPGTSILLIALAAEPLRALNWVAGSTMLANGRVKAWAGVQVAGLAALIAITLSLTPVLGVTALAVGIFTQTLVASTGTYVALHPSLSGSDWVGIGGLVVTCLWLAGVGLTDTMPVYAGIVLALPILQTAFWGRRIRTDSHAPVEQAAERSQHTSSPRPS